MSEDTEKEKRSFWGGLYDMFLDFYPVLWGALIIVSEFGDSINNFKEICFDKKKHFMDYTIDFFCIALIVSLVVWAALNYQNKRKKEKENERKLKERDLEWDASLKGG